MLLHNLIYLKEGLYNDTRDIHIEKYWFFEGSLIKVKSV